MGKHSMEEDQVPKAFKKKTSEEESQPHRATSIEQHTRRTRGGNMKNQQGKKKKGKLKTFGKIVLVLLLILAIIAGIVFWYINDKLGKIQQVDIKEEDLGIAQETKKALSGYRNIALFGIDSKSDDYGLGNRSDCIIIASINKKTKEVTLASIYRDTYVKIDGHGLDKITHAYSYGGAQLAVNTLNTNLDLNITEFVTVNWDAVAEAVDELGGVTIEIEKSELSAVNSAVEETAESIGKSSAMISGTGSQTLNGVQAVAYSRTRNTAGGDYKRTERMRTVIMAMVSKLKTKSVTQLNTFADNILPKVSTNISAMDILGLVPDAMNYEITKSIGWPYETKGITLDRWYGVPITLASNVTKLHQELFEENDYTLPETVKTISNSIVTKTGYSK